MIERYNKLISTKWVEAPLKCYAKSFNTINRVLKDKSKPKKDIEGKNIEESDKKNPYVIPSYLCRVLE
jgi:hypothetical protein